MRNTWFIIAALAGTAIAGPADDILAARDKNKDGALTPDELPDPAIFKKADYDKDGKITLLEIKAYLNGGIAPAETEADKKAQREADKKRAAQKRELEKKRASQAAIVQPRSLDERVADFFRRFDKNKDQKIQKAEFQAGDEVFKVADVSRNGALSRREVRRYIRNILTEARKNPNRGNFFELYDLNRDKKVTKREYSGPPSFFRAHDHNKDRVVDEKEINLGPGGGEMKKGDDKFLADGPTRAPKRGLLDRYDEDKNGRITLKELKGAESVLRRLDKNGDGVLSGSEVR